MTRLFISAELGIPLVERLVLVQKEVQGRLEARDYIDLRLVQAENLHLTLKFIGDVPFALSERIQETLHEFAGGLFPFEIQVQGLGTFPEQDPPQILWSGLEDKSSELIGLLRETLERELEKIGIPLDTREFKSHITLGRFRGEAPKRAEYLSDLNDLLIGKSYVRDIVLYASELSHAGPTYTVIDRFPLGPQ